MEKYDSDVLTENTEDGKLKEPTCNAEGLNLKTSIYNQDGLLITCTDGDGQIQPDNSTVIIPAENHCLLLCNMYPTIKFFVDYKAYPDPDTINMGERVWVYKLYDADEDEAPIEMATGECTTKPCPENHVDNIIKCWDSKDESE